MVFKKICVICSDEFKTYKEHQQTCSKKCMGVNQRGENNPNYGNAWSDERKVAHGNLVKSLVDDEYRYKAGSANRGVKFSQERIDKMHGDRDSSSYSHPHTEETKKVIGKKSKEKFTEDFHKKFRKALIDSGRAVRDSDKDDFTIYKTHAEWIHKMWDIVEDQTLLETVGIFNSFTNKNGCERDHKLSRFTGFELKVFPEILRHPANCQLLTHSENSSKREKSSITVDNLFVLIRSYSKDWVEQDFILELIERYESGERFVADEYRRD